MAVRWTADTGSTREGLDSVDRAWLSFMQMSHSNHRPQAPHQGRLPRVPLRDRFLGGTNSCRLVRVGLETRDQRGLLG